MYVFVPGQLHGQLYALRAPGAAMRVLRGTEGADFCGRESPRSLASVKLLPVPSIIIVYNRGKARRSA
jgi:hypothetical protein